MEAVAPTCSEFILECEIANTVMNGTECCSSLFDPTPTFSQYGKIILVKCEKWDSVIRKYFSLLSQLLKRQLARERPRYVKLDMIEKEEFLFL